MLSTPLFSAKFNFKKKGRNSSGEGRKGGEEKRRKYGL